MGNDFAEEGQEEVVGEGQAEDFTPKGGAPFDLSDVGAHLCKRKVPHGLNSHRSPCTQLNPTDTEKTG